MKSLISLLCVVFLLVCQGCWSSAPSKDSEELKTLRAEREDRIAREKEADAEAKQNAKIAAAVKAAMPAPAPREPTKADMQMAALPEVVKNPKGCSTDFSELGLYVRTGDPATEFEKGIADEKREREKSIADVKRDADKLALANAQNAAHKELQKSEFEQEKWRTLNGIKVARHEDEHKAEVKELHGKLETEKRQEAELKTKLDAEIRQGAELKVGVTQLRGQIALLEKRLANAVTRANAGQLSARAEVSSLRNTIFSLRGELATKARALRELEQTLAKPRVYWNGCQYVEVPR